MLLLLYVLNFFQDEVENAKIFEREGYRFCLCLFLFFVAIMKLLEIFVPREKPLYQDEFSYCRMYLVQTIKQSK